jgi:CBS domain-containing protein
MTARVLTHDLVRRVPLVRRDAPVRAALEELLRTGAPALPVVATDDTLCGIFGEREFVEAIFPGYLGQLHFAGVVPHSLDGEIERRSACLQDDVGRHVNREHVHVREGCSDAQIAETFLHHRVLIVPVVDDRLRVRGVVTRTDFFTALATRALSSSRRA